MFSKDIQELKNQIESMPEGQDKENMQKVIDQIEQIDQMIEERGEIINQKQSVIDRIRSMIK